MRDLSLALALGALASSSASCSASETRPTGPISVEAAQDLIRKGEVRWVVEPNRGCNAVYLRDGTVFCWEPREFDLQSWIMESGLGEKVDGLIIE